MNRSILKNYAPQARRDFIQAVTDRAALFGLSAKKTEPMTEQGDLVLIAGNPFPRSVAAKRRKLEDRINRLGFAQTMEAMAYTWFNRLVAIRYMELHGYFDHGYRILSPSPHAGEDSPRGSPSSNVPEIVEHAQHVDLPGLDKLKVVALKLDGTKEEELYRLLLVGQCNALHKALPFLFEAIDDETELLLPDNLLHSDSLIRTLVNEIEEEDWQEVEIIGWLYQFYVIEEKKRIDTYSKKKPVLPQDIGPKTQLFTPNWIVKYLVQNSLGRQWVATYPDSPLKAQMEYYIEPAEQTPEVQAKLAEITPTSLNPEELTLIDPACGSGHILAESYDLLQRIYQERGYRAKDIPRLILEKNLFGLEIDDRAAQLAAFALMMKARADDRRIFDGEAKPNVVAFEDSTGTKASEIFYALISPIKGEPSGEPEPDAPDGHLFQPDDNLFTRAEAAKATANRQLPTVNFTQADIASLLEVFENATTFGSLIQIPPKLAAKLPEIEKRLDDVLKLGDLTHASAHVLKPLLQQARLLARQYDAVVANPPYMGNLFSDLKAFVQRNYPESKTDLYSVFIERGFELAHPNGRNAMVTMHGWMFLSTYETFRQHVLRRSSIETLAHFGPRAFGSISGEVVQTAAFSALATTVPGITPVFFRLVDGEEEVKRQALLERNNRFASIQQIAFHELPGSPIAYWLSRKAVSVFSGPRIATVAESGGRCKTHNDEWFVRMWWEVSSPDVGLNGSWRFYEKGGEVRKYFGNRTFVVNWSDTARQTYAGKGGLSNSQFWNTEALSWSDISSGATGFRFKPHDMEYSSASPTLMFATRKCDLFVLGLLNSPVTHYCLDVINPTFHANVGDVLRVPLVAIDGAVHSQVEDNARQLVEIAKSDWDSHETSDGFPCLPLLASSGLPTAESWAWWRDHCHRQWETYRSLERQNANVLLAASGLDGELDANTSGEEVTLYLPSREEDIKRLISYSLGCMMGRYSLDDPGLIYAHSGNQGFDPSKYRKFPADEDGIIPFTEFNWFPDAAASRFEKFIATAWPAETLEVNLKFVAESLGTKKGETSRDTIRRYLANDFYKHHLSMYKKRPIYWLFSSGKQRGFQALVYLHRYNEGTLARMRTEYVIPLLGKLPGRIAQLTDDIAVATSSAQRKRLEREKDVLSKQLVELQAYDEKLRHYADQRIALDLDDGVKVNYAKFGDLLAEVKAVCGSKDKD